MNTLIPDLSQLIDNHLDCYQAAFLGCPDHKIRWVIYFYRNKQKLINFCRNNPDPNFIKIMKKCMEIKNDVIQYRYGDILELGFKIGDEELVSLAYPQISSDSDRQRYILEAIKYGHTKLVLKYEHPCLDFRRYTYDIHLLVKIIAAYRSGNQQIIEHIMDINSKDLEESIPKMIRLLMMASAASGSDKESLNRQFIELYNDLIGPKEQARVKLAQSALNHGNIQLYNNLTNIEDNDALRLIQLALEENNVEIYNFLRSLILPRYERLDNYLIENVNDTPNVVGLLMKTLDLGMLEVYITTAYKNGRKNMFNRLTEINPTLITTVDIMYNINNKINIDNFKTVLSIAPPSIREIWKLKGSYLGINRHDLYVCLCSVEYIIKETSKYIGQQIISI